MTDKVPQPDLVDLHVHSSASDGAYPPREVVERAAEVGLKAVALTDHDTTAGLAEALAAGPDAGIEVIPGVEISGEFEDGACHILGYFIDPDAPGLAGVLRVAREGRERRNDAILKRLNDLGFDLTMDDVTRKQTAGTLTRAHFAAAMLEKGYVRNWVRKNTRQRPAYKARLLAAIYVPRIHHYSTAITRSAFLAPLLSL
ncbi:MAG: PHP domain-containing protein [Phycisphaerae bacterium]